VTAASDQYGIRRRGNVLAADLSAKSSSSWEHAWWVLLEFQLPFEGEWLFQTVHFHFVVRRGACGSARILDEARNPVSATHLLSGLLLQGMWHGSNLLQSVPIISAKAMYGLTSEIAHLFFNRYLQNFTISLPPKPSPSCSPSSLPASKRLLVEPTATLRLVASHHGRYFNLLESFSEVEDMVVPLSDAEAGKVVHTHAILSSTGGADSVGSRSFTADVEDSDFGVRITAVGDILYPILACVACVGSQNTVLLPVRSDSSSCSSGHLGAERIVVKI
jgi:hypothetical protein